MFNREIFVVNILKLDSVETEINEIIFPLLLYINDSSNYL